MQHWQEQHGHPFRFTTEASVDLADDDALMQAMVASGFRQVFLGIETPDQESLLVTNKRQNTRSPLTEAVDRITSHGLAVIAGFILGFDGEQPGAGKRITAFVNQTGIPLAMVGVLQDLPNTALWNRLANEQRLMQHPDDFDEGVNTHLLNFVPHQADTRAGCRVAANQCRPLCPVSLPGLCLSLLPQAGYRTAHPTTALGSECRVDSRWLFWMRLARIGLQQPQVLDEYLWFLMLNEHFIDYQACIRDQVAQQLAYHDQRHSQAA